ncbi:tetratricopeptide repeat protein [Flavobacterium denitrificans]|uniref:tetratricopeptide repeat protein n=1 Tax=Flavobacterium denitrificans TaxID=281361 RepID=UPI0004079292|nr:tetratricopeptide repeat protein [Flavobacterium denitrificans]
MDLKKYKQAILDYTTAIQINPTNPEPYAYRGRGYYEINEINKSILDFNNAIKLDEKFGYAYLNRALVRYTKLKDYAGGCADLKIASDLGESEADDYFKEGICD